MRSFETANSQLATSMQILLQGVHVLTSLKKFQVKRCMRLFTHFSRVKVYVYVIFTSLPVFELYFIKPSRGSKKIPYTQTLLVKMKLLSIKLQFHLQFIIVKL